MTISTQKHFYKEKLNERHISVAVANSTKIFSLETRVGRTTVRRPSVYNLDFVITQIFNFPSF